MTLLPDTPVHKRERYQPCLIESTWVILDLQSGERAGKASYRVEIQARWAAEQLNAAYREGVERGRLAAL